MSLGKETKQLHVAGCSCSKLSGSVLLLVVYLTGTGGGVFGLIGFVLSLVILEFTGITDFNGSVPVIGTGCSLVEPFLSFTTEFSTKLSLVPLWVFARGSTSRLISELCSSSMVLLAGVATVVDTVVWSV